MKRIRYVKNEVSLTTKTPILAGTDVYTGSIILSDLSVLLTNSKGEVIFKGMAKDVSLAKKLVKSELKSLGAVFFDEVRNGTKPVEV